MECNPFYIFKSFFIEICKVFMVRNMFIKYRHLPTPYTCTNITKAIVVANFFVLVVWESLACLCCKEHNTLFCFFVRTNYCTATGSSYHLIAIEAHYTIIAKCTNNLLVIPTAKSFSSIFNDWNSVSFCNFYDFFYLCRHTIKVDYDDGFRLFTCLFYSILNCSFE